MTGYGEEVKDISFLADTWINMNSVFHGNLTIKADGAYSWQDPDDFWQNRSEGRIMVYKKHIVFLPADQNPVAYTYVYDANDLMKLKMKNAEEKDSIEYIFSN
ncbi:MAG: hypothetical protein JW969_00205 [Spirochaetales bacterium]|nr:hypothetical protein [Spirochaetales bacterium]